MSTDHDIDDDEVRRVLERLDAVERRLGALEASPGSPGGTPGPAVSAGSGTSSGTKTGTVPAAEADRFWALEGVRARHAEPGGVVFAGAVTTPDGRTAHWQLGATTEDLLAEGLVDGAEAFAALGHPVRLRILETALRGPMTVQDLVDSGEFGTSGQIYHHLRQLVAARWLHSPGRGRYEVPVDRVVPLLTLGLAVTR